MSIADKAFIIIIIIIIIVVAAMSLSPTPTAFSRSLEAFKRQLSLRDIEAFEFATFKELKNTIGHIQHEQAHRRGYRNLNKIRPFLQFLQQYARVIEQFISAKPDFLAFIWVSRTCHPTSNPTLLLYLEAFANSNKGPIKLCLQVIPCKSAIT